MEDWTIEEEWLRKEIRELQEQILQLEEKLIAERASHEQTIAWFGERLLEEANLRQSQFFGLKDESFLRLVNELLAELRKKENVAHGN